MYIFKCGVVGGIEHPGLRNTCTKQLGINPTHIIIERWICWRTITKRKTCFRKSMFQYSYNFTINVAMLCLTYGTSIVFLAAQLKFFFSLESTISRSELAHNILHPKYSQLTIPLTYLFFIEGKTDYPIIVKTKTKPLSYNSVTIVPSPSHSQ
jgi:hypothetical protein